MLANKLRIAVVSIFVVINVSVLSPATFASESPPQRVKSRSELESRLHTDHPFFQISPAGQKAFLDSLRFGKKGELLGFDNTPLKMELSRPDIEALLDSIGMPEWKQQPFVTRAPSVRDNRLKTSAEILARYYQISADFERARQTDPLVARIWHRQEFPQRFRRWLERPASQLSDGDLIVLFEASASSAFMALSETLSLQQHMLLQEKVRRNMASERNIQSMHEHLLAARLYVQATQLAAQFPALNLPVPPRIHDSIPAEYSGPSILELADDDGLRRSALDLSSGFRLVVVAHPYCHFSAQFTRDLAKDARLREQLKPLSPLLLVTQRDNLVDEAVREWNREQPAFPYVGSWKDEEWVARQVRMDATPGFFLLHNGFVIAQFASWPDDGSHREQLQALIAKAATAAPTAPSPSAPEAH